MILAIFEDPQVTRNWRSSRTKTCKDLILRLRFKKSWDLTLSMEENSDEGTEEEEEVAPAPSKRARTASAAKALFAQGKSGETGLLLNGKI